MPRPLREHFQHMLIWFFCSPPIYYQIYNTERDLKFDPVSLTFYPPVEDLTKGMNTWEDGKSSYTNFRIISQTCMTQLCKISINSSSSDFFPKSMSNFTRISDLYLLTCSFLHSYCSMTCLCFRLSSSGHNSMVWVLDSMQKKLLPWWELRTQNLPGWRLSCLFLSYSSLVLLRQSCKFCCGREIYNTWHKISCCPVQLQVFGDSPTPHWSQWVVF